MAADGVREVTLLGQNVNSYGRDLPRGEDGERASFAGLLRRLDAIEGIERIRYTSPHPKDMREDVIRAHAELASVCEHIHLPLQSGSSRILKAMRRTYDRDRYLDRVAMIREHLPDVALSTDIIVGFPGETEEDFEQTLEVVEQVGYDSAFTFIFSPRRGTEAAELTEGLVPHPVKIERMERLVELVQRQARERAQRFVGRTVRGAGRRHLAQRPRAPARGAPRHNKVVNFAGLASPGELTEVEIVAATSQTLTGEERLLARVAGSARPRHDEDPRRRSRGVRRAAGRAGGRAGRARARARCWCGSSPAASATPTSTRPPASIRPATRRRCSATRARASSSGSGEGVTLLRQGDHVVTLFSPQCGECIHCRSPLTNLCLAIREQQNLGYLPDGTTRLSLDGEPLRHFMGTSTFAEYTVMPEIALAKIDPEAPLGSRLPVRLRALDGPRRGDADRRRAGRLDLRGVRRRHGRPGRRRRLPAAGRRADRLRRPLARAPGARARAGRDRHDDRRARTPSRRSSR